jgi:hypothetical protein
VLLVQVLRIEQAPQFLRATNMPLLPRAHELLSFPKGEIETGAEFSKMFRMTGSVRLNLLPCRLCRPHDFE